MGMCHVQGLRTLTSSTSTDKYHTSMDLARSLFQPPVPASPLRESPLPSTTSNHFLSLLFFQESNSSPTSALIDHEQLKNSRFLKKTFETVLAGMVRDRNRHQLIILCPVQQSLMGSDSLSKLEWEWGGIDEEFVMSHIARVPDRDHPVTKGLLVNTLNGRSMIVTDTTVTTAKGFKLLKQARLVSEQIFYDNEGRGWIIQFIDRPLVGMSQDGDRSPSSPSSPGNGGNDSGRSRLSGIFGSNSRSDRQRPTKAGRRTKHRPSPLQLAYPFGEMHRRVMTRPLLTLQIALQRFPGSSQKLEHFIMDFNDATMIKSNLDEIRADVERLLSDSVELLNQLDPHALSAMLDEYSTTVDSLDQLLENYIMNATYDIVFFKITLQLKQQDWDLAEAIRELRNLDLGQVGLPDTQQHYQCLVSALNEFQSIGVLRTPEEKLGCLIQSVRVTGTLSGGADDLIPILLLTVLRSGISNLASNLYYMKNFVMFGDTSRGEYGYSLSTLEAVSRYIISHSKQLSQLSARNQDYWEKVCAGDEEGIKKIYAEASKAAAETKPMPPPIPRRPSAASLESNSDVPFDWTLQGSLSTSPLHSRDAEGNNGVLLACKAQQIGVLRYLLDEQGDAIDVSSYEGKTPLMLSVDLGNVEMTHLILQAFNAKDKAAINKQDVLGNTAVHVCVSNGNVELLEVLLNAKPDLGLPNNEGDTPIILAAKLSENDEKYTGVISIIASKMKSEDLNRQNNSGDTVIHFITDSETIAVLVGRGANPEVENYAGWTPLLKWALHDNTTVVKGLLGTGGVDALMTDSRGYTPLHMACLRGNLEMVQMLQAQTPIDVQSAIDGSTPLQLACQSSSASVVDFLLQNGANPELRDWTNESPADMTNDAIILDMLDNALLFWNSQLDYVLSTTTTSAPIPPNSKTDSKETTLGLVGRRVIRVVRGTMEQDGKVRYIVKSGSTSDPSTIVTMPRSLDDFRFLRQNLLVEGPDVCIPSLDNFYSPFLLSPSRPSKTVLAISARRLDMFLNYLSNHPVLANHELVWEFMLMPELQRDMIAERSLMKQENAMDSIFDNYPPVVENLNHEETFFKHLNEEIMRLDAAVQQVRKCARKLSRSAQDVPQQLDIMTGVLDHSSLISFDGKSEYVQALSAIASTQTTMHISDIESLGNLFEDFSFVIDGTLTALKHPQEIIASIRHLKVAAQKAELSMRRNDMWWSGLSSISEGAITALGGAGAALGVVGHAATSTFEAVSGSIVPGGGSQHSKAPSESTARRYSETLEESRTTSPPSSPARMRRPSFSSTSPPQSKGSLVVKLSPNTSQTNLNSITGGASPAQPRPRHLQESLSSRTLSASSILSSPFSSIAAVTSAATGQSSLEEIKDKIDKASSLLNSLRGSLFEELAHLQNHHTKELERTMRDFGARQMQIEKSRLRDMVEILNDLRVESNVGTFPAGAGGSNSSLGSQMFLGSTKELTTGRNSRVISRQPSINALTLGVGPPGGGSSFPFDFEQDEKSETRVLQRQYDLQRKNSTIRGRSRSTASEHGGPSLRKKDEDSMSEKIPFDD